MTVRHAEQKICYKKLRVIATFFDIIITNMKSVKRFVVQKHTRAEEVHWDLMLETAEALLETYRLEVPPEKLSQKTTTAVKTFNHPPKFLTYEGSVNKGKGSVEIADSGTYQPLSKNANGQQFQLEGKILKGKFVLHHIEGDKWEFGLATEE